LYALDPSSGALLASIDVDPRTPAHRAATPNAEVSIESSPVVGHFGTEGDRIFVGMDVHNDAAIGRTGLLAFELKTNTGGTTPYRFEFKYKFDPETETVRTTLTEGSGTGYGCGGVWSSPALDATALNGDGVVVFGTSNCVNNGPDEAQTEANPSEGIFALRAKDGSLLWKFRPRGANPYDDDFGASPNMLPGGLVGEGGKDGTYYAFNRVTGAPAWSSHLGQSGRLNEQFSFGGMIGTTAVGTVSSLLTGQEPAVFAATALSSPVGEPIGTGTPDQWIDESLAEDPARMFSLHAISAVDGRVLWRTPLSRQAFGAPTYANGVLLVPSTFDFTVKAFHGDTGLLLWEHPLNAPPSSAPAIVGDSIYIGAGTSAGGLPLDNFGGIWAFELAA
jgi:outer membrane protein assembly factor BamB